jgi:hypothetical protein
MIKHAYEYIGYYENALNWIVEVRIMDSMYVIKLIKYL